MDDIRDIDPGTSSEKPDPKRPPKLKNPPPGEARREIGPEDESRNSPG